MKNQNTDDIKLKPGEISSAPTATTAPRPAG